MKVNCWWCGQIFEAKRSTAHYCSGRCRATAKRRRDFFGYDHSDEARFSFYQKYKAQLDTIKTKSEDAYGWIMLVLKGSGEEAALNALRAVWSLREAYEKWVIKPS